MADAAKNQTMDPAQAEAQLKALRDKIEGKISAGDSTMRYFRLIGQLDQIEKLVPRDEWLECAVLYNFHQKRRPARTVSYLRELRAIRRKSKDLERFRAFKDRVEAMIAPLSVTGHGYVPTLDKLNPDTIWSELRRLASGIQALGVPVFVNSGTLLGLVRDGALIAHDNDADLAVIMQASSQTDAAAKWRELGDKLRAAGLLDDQAFKPEDPEILKLAEKETGIEIDLFPGWEQDGRIYVYPHTVGELTPEDVLPLQPTPQPGLYMPANPEKMLALNYGEDWRTPDPLFRFGWPRAKRRFNEFRVALGSAPADTAQTDEAPE